jgi:hypothetical protein
MPDDYAYSAYSELFDPETAFPVHNGEPTPFAFPLSGAAAAPGKFGFGGGKARKSARKARKSSRKARKSSRKARKSSRKARKSARK